MWLASSYGLVPELSPCIHLYFGWIQCDQRPQAPSPWLPASMCCTFKLWAKITLPCLGCCRWDFATAMGRQLPTLPSTAMTKRRGSQERPALPTGATWHSTLWDTTLAGPFWKVFAQSSLGRQLPNLFSGSWEADIQSWRQHMACWHYLTFPC